jgi:hypothetical protein
VVDETTFGLISKCLLCIAESQCEKNLITVTVILLFIDQECSQELLDGSVSHVSSERCGLCYEVTGTRLTQIRKQARCKYRKLDHDRADDNQFKHLQRKTTRLSQMKQQARCKSKNGSSSLQMINGPENKQRQGRILRLSQMKHQARSKNNATVKERTEEYVCVNQHCNRCKGE